MKRICTLFLISILFSACSKNSGVTEDVTGPVIKIQYPLDNPALPRGFPLCIKVNISDDKTLALVTFEVNDGSPAKEYIPITRFTDIIERHVVDPALSGQFIATIKALDEAGNISSVSVPFSINN